MLDRNSRVFLNFISNVQSPIKKYFGLKFSLLLIRMYLHPKDIFTLSEVQYIGEVGVL